VLYTGHSTSFMIHYLEQFYRSTQYFQINRKTAPKLTKTHYFITYKYIPFWFDIEALGTTALGCGYWIFWINLKKVYPLHVLLSNRVISISLDLFLPVSPQQCLVRSQSRHVDPAATGPWGRKREWENERTGRTSVIVVQEKVINSSLLPVPRFCPVQPASACTRGCLVVLQTSYCSSSRSSVRQELLDL
jgi:hypothetical protein